MVAFPAGALPIRSSRMSHPGDALADVFERLGLHEPTGRDAVIRALVRARIIEPSSKLYSIRVLQEAGLPAPSYCTIKRRLPGYAKDELQRCISAACAAPAGLDCSGRCDAPAIVSRPSVGPDDDGAGAPLGGPGVFSNPCRWWILSGRGCVSV